MVALKRFYWTVAILGLSFMLFFWGSTPQEAHRYKPMRSGRPDVQEVANSTVVTASTDATQAVTLGLPEAGHAPAAVPQGPRVWFEPAEPRPGDRIRIALADQVDPASLRIRWTHGQVPLTHATQALSLDLTSSMFRKTHTIHAYVEGPDWRQELVARLANRAPELSGFSQPRRYGDQHLIEVEGSDPDQDKIWLTLPANVPGVRARGMNLEFDFTEITDVRSVPVVLTDGSDNTPFIYTVRPDQFK